MSTRIRTAVTMTTATGILMALAACGSSDNGATQGAEDCTPAHPDLETINAGELSVAVFEDPPLATFDGDRLEGIEGSIMHLIAERECLRLVPLKFQASGIIPAVETGRADVALGGYVLSLRREEVVAQSDPVLLNPLTITSPGASPIDSMEKMEGSTLGSVVGFQSIEEIEEFLDDTGGQLNLYDGKFGAFSDLAVGRVEGVAASALSARYLAETQGVEDPFVFYPPEDERLRFTINHGQTNFPVRQSNLPLRDAINEAIADLREDGTLQSLVEEAGIDDAERIANPGDVTYVDQDS